MTRTRLAICVCALTLSACERGSGKGAASDAATTSGTAAPAAGATTTEPRAAWDNALGVILATPSLESGAPTVFLGDSATQGDVPAELFNHDAHTVKATLHLGAPIRGCAFVRTGSVSSSEPASAPLVWSLAFSPGAAQPIGIDDISDLTPKDSAALAVRLRQIVGTLPDDSASAPFRGLPVVLRDAWKLQLADGGAVTVALATRSTNVESNPRAQLTVLIAETDSTAGLNNWRLGYTRRDAGPEDRAEGTDLLAAFILRNGHPAVAFVRDGDRGIQIEIVERTAPAVWQLRWSSASLPCTY